MQLSDSNIVGTFLISFVENITADCIHVEGALRVLLWYFTKQKKSEKRKKSDGSTPHRLASVPGVSLANATAPSP